MEFYQQAADCKCEEYIERMHQTLEGSVIFPKKSLGHGQRLSVFVEHFYLVFHCWFLADSRVPDSGAVV